MRIFFLSTRNWNALQHLERENANLGTRKKSFEKARGNAEREEEMKEPGHASREGPAGMRAQLCNLLRVFKSTNISHDLDRKSQKKTS